MNSGQRLSNRPTPKMKREYHRLCDRWGEPSNLYVFDAQELDHAVSVQPIHVPTLKSDETSGVTSFVTLGMADHRMTRADYFCELTFAFRGQLNDHEQLQCARMLANLVEYPFGFKLRSGLVGNHS
jgi:hypothetical protein